MKMHRFHKKNDREEERRKCSIRKKAYTKYYNDVWGEDAWSEEEEEEERATGDTYIGDRNGGNDGAED